MSNLVELTASLTKALDANYDVVDRDEVLRIINKLEGSVITKEQLEATRLAKFINQLRRRTKDDGLSRRCKLILKAWREMVGITNVTPTPSYAAHKNYENSIEESGKEQNHANLNSVLEINERTSNNVRRNCASPIIIDIHDSNSSNLTKLPIAFTASNINSNKEQHQINTSNPNVETTTTSKVKKNKKDKKNKERREPYISGHAIGAIVQSEIIKPINVDEKLRFSNMCGETKQPNVSDILSLSNSSMSSNFPPADNISGLNKNGSNAASELTFSGKFTQGGIFNQISSPIISRNNISRPAETTTASTAITNKLISSSFLGAFNYSNESSSNSHISHVGGMDLQENINLNKINKLHLLEHQQQNLHMQNLLDSQQQQNQHLLIKNKPKNVPNLIKLENVEDVKVPKKRGRKKGSKGVDCIISNDTSLSSQMLQLKTSLNNSVAGMKKVKTTKELYAEMQNRKTVNISTANSKENNKNNIMNKLSSPAINFVNSLQATTSRPASSCSEISNYSSRTLDATGNTLSLTHGIHSDSETRDSSSIITNINHNKTNRMDEDCTISPKLEYVENNNDKYKQLKESLITITSSFPKLDINHVLYLMNENSETNCGCSIVVENYCSNENEKDDKESYDQDSKIENYAKPHIYDKKQQEKQKDEFGTTTINDLFNTHAQNNAKDNNRNEKVIIELNSNTIKPSIEVVKKPKKSIFDFDFDDDDDPLLELKAEVENTTKREEKEAELGKEGDEESNDVNMDEDLTEDEKIKQDDNDNYEIFDDFVRNQTENVQQPTIQSLDDIEELVIKPIQLKYIITESENCIAKKKLISTKQITDYHINSLHNFYIPNVNGNWNDVIVVLKESQGENNNGNLKENENSIIHDALLSDDFVNDDDDIVPKYGVLIKDNLRKSISKIDLEKKHKLNRRDILKRMEQSYKLPFLGVAKSLLHIKRSSYKSQQEKPQQKYKIVEQPEENDNYVGQNIPLTDTFNIETASSNKNTIREENKVVAETLEDIIMDTSLLTTNNNYDYLKIELEEDEHTEMVDKAKELLKTAMLENNNNQQIIKKATNNAANNLMDCSLMEEALDEHENAVSVINLHRSNSESSNSSNNSNTSLKLTQQSINLKLKQHRLLQQQQLQQQNHENYSYDDEGKQQKRLEEESDNDFDDFIVAGDYVNDKKRKRKYYHHDENKNRNNNEKKERKKIKRIKIAINGDIATQRQISYNDNMSSSNASSTFSNDEDYDEELKEIKDEQINNNNNNDEYDGDGDNSEDDEDEEEKQENYYNYDDEDECDDNDNEHFHEVISHNDDTTNNHIVLTIKKLNRKSNSSSPLPTVDILSTPIQSPSLRKSLDTLAAENDHNFLKPTDKIKPFENQKNLSAHVKKKVVSEEYRREQERNFELFKKKCDYIKQRLAKRMERKKRAANMKNENNARHSVKNNKSRKLHRKLFLPHELFPIGHNKEIKDICGHYHEQLFDNCSCSSECDTCSGSDEDNYDDNYNNSLPKLKNKIRLALNNLNGVTIMKNKNLNVNSIDNEENSDEDHNNHNLENNITDDNDDDHNDNNDDDDNNKNEKIIDNIKNEISNDLPSGQNPEKEEINNNINKNKNNVATETNLLPEHNNGFLESFNKLYAEFTDIDHVHLINKNIILTENQVIKKSTTTNATTLNNLNYSDKFDVDNILKNENNEEIATSSVIIKEKSTVPSIKAIPAYPLTTNMKPFNKYVTGKSKENKNVGEVNQFKEWYQVVQLQSYKNELLTVLPYVILE